MCLIGVFSDKNIFNNVPKFVQNSKIKKIYSKIL